MRVPSAMLGILCSLLAAGAAAQPQNAQYGRDQIQAGFNLYSLQCALCHGANGDGIAGVVLPRQIFRRASTDDDIKRTVTNGVAAAGMPSFTFQPAELASIVAYIRSGFDITGTTFKVGDAARGKTVYDKNACNACHRVGDAGSRVAPDLSDIGMLRKPSAIQRSLLDPTAGMEPINRTVTIVTRDGRTIQGRRLNEDTATVQLIDKQAKLVSLMKSDVSTLELGKTSDMPSFAGKLGDNDVADLLAYLLTLKG